TYELPVEVQVLGVYPHAHYLGKEVHGFATLPGGRREWLIRIDDWDFNWQDQYRYRSPIKLPKGTTLTMRWIYDNSAANPRNPNAPPKRVRYGSLSSDEMSDLVIQVLPDNRDDLVTLLRDLDWKYEIREITYLVRENHTRGNELAAAGKFTEAIGRYQAAIRLKADDPQVFLDMAEAFAALADYQSAILVAERAVAVAVAAGSDSLEGIGRRRLEVYRRRN
ncbi:MAG: tetratricopeptide repeat protein, partial [Gemmatimonadetes bacterium]|nr:tetratricopeptide repeat protein [Gemmatimonadota bacterium]